MQIVLSILNQLITRSRELPEVPSESTSAGSSEYRLLCQLIWIQKILKTLVYEILAWVQNTGLDTGNTENPCVCNTNTGSAKIIDRKNTEESNAKILEGGPHQKKNVQAL